MSSLPKSQSDFARSSEEYVVEAEFFLENSVSSER